MTKTFSCVGGSARPPLFHVDAVTQNPTRTYSLWYLHTIRPFIPTHVVSIKAIRHGCITWLWFICIFTISGGLGLNCFLVVGITCKTQLFTKMNCFVTIKHCCQYYITLYIDSNRSFNRFASPVRSRIAQRHYKRWINHNLMKLVYTHVAEE